VSKLDFICKFRPERFHKIGSRLIQEGGKSPEDGYEKNLRRTRLKEGKNGRDTFQLPVLNNMSLTLGVNFAPRGEFCPLGGMLTPFFHPMG
jgi:hypothetical protein